MQLGRLSRRAGAVCMVLVLLFTACYSASQADRAVLEAAQARKHRLRLTYPNGNVIIKQGWTVAYPFIVGEIDESRGVVPSDPVERSATHRRFNVDEATKVESYKLSGWKVAGLSGAAVVGAVVAAALIIVATSCPTVYVVDGAQQVLVGEAYPGAIFRSVQREDLLPLPPIEGSTLKLRLRNDNPEIQYTDAASLMLIEHQPNQRAVATHDGRALVVSGSRAPARVIDLNGADVSERVRAADDLVWQSDMDVAFRAGQRDPREGLVATFDESSAERLALEIRAENTLWMSAVFHSGFAMMGSSFGPLMKAANSAERTRIEAWRAREGVDLRVELLRDGNWSEVALVQTPGVAALRTMAVPLGPAGTGQVQVRLSGGFGFWRIGSVALTTIIDDEPEATIVSSSEARALVGEKDGRYHVMRQYGESVDLTFALPPQGTGVRTAFLASSGYYNPLPPQTRRPQLAALNAISRTTGGLAGLGIDLYARHREQLQEERGR